MYFDFLLSLALFTKRRTEAYFQMHVLFNGYIINALNMYAHLAHTLISMYSTSILSL